MSGLTNLILEGSTGLLYSTERYTLKPETEKRDQSAERAPYGDTWFLIGDGKRSPQAVGFTVQIRANDLRTAIDELQDLQAVLDTVTLVRWGEFYRPVLGLDAVTRSQTLLGYRVDISLWPSGPTWLDDLGQPATI